jgi:hypothetical protein
MNTITRRVPTVARVGLGLVLALMGLGTLIPLLPQLPMSGDTLPFIAATEIVAALLLVSGRLVPLALALLTPVIVNIASFHAVLAPSISAAAE